MPRLDALFRISFYLCLLISTISLAFTAWGQLPDTLFFYVPMIICVVVAFFLNDRWTLSVTASNILALAIIAGWPIWLVLTLRGNRVNVDELEVELVRLALPFFAPLLSTLLLAKLFRPKFVRDYWTIHLMGLVQMVLACVLAMTNKLDRDAPLFPLAVLAYLLTLVWTLRNFNLYSLYMNLPDLRPSRLQSERPLPVPMEARVSLGIGTSLRWFAATTLVGLAIFFLVPRGATTLTTGSFGAFAQQSQTGFKPSMDLSGEGELQISEELVFRATVRNSSGNAIQLWVYPKWRGVTCVEYDNGRWRPVRKDNTGMSRRAGLPSRGELLVSFELDVRRVRQAGPISSDDIPNRVVGEVPLFALETLIGDERRGGSMRIGLDPNSPDGDWRTVHPHFSREEGCVSATLLQNRPVRNIFYQQLIGENELNLTEWTQQVSPDFGRSMDEFLRLTAKVPPRLFATGRMKQLAEEMLAAEQVPPTATAREKAKALERRLESTGGFGYSLNRRRVDSRLDPNEDFLVNVKEGTCERYASALALLLRAIDIPSRVVIGFRGADWNSVGQFYEVRELHTHAWVEAVVDTTYEQTEGGRSVTSVTWLSLDPTPSVDAQSRDQSLFIQNLSFARMLWEFFILDFSGDMQRQRFFNQLNRLGYDRLEEALRRYGMIGLILWGIAFLLSCVLAVLLLRILQARLREWRAYRRELAWLPRVPFFRRFIDLFLRRWKLRPVQSQTAVEYADAAARRLREDRQPADITALPLDLADQYYAVRFGDAPPGETAAAAAPALEALGRLKPGTTG